jgi:hypothetical protein
MMEYKGCGHSDTMNMRRKICMRITSSADADSGGSLASAKFDSKRLNI